MSRRRQIFPLRRYSLSQERKRRRVMVSSPARTGARPNLRRRIFRITLFAAALLLGLARAAASPSVAGGGGCGAFPFVSLMGAGGASATGSSVSSAFLWRRVGLAPVLGVGLCVNDLWSG